MQVGGYNPCRDKNKRKFVIENCKLAGNNQLDLRKNAFIDLSILGVENGL